MHLSLFVDGRCIYSSSSSRLLRRGFRHEDLLGNIWRLGHRSFEVWASGEPAVVFSGGGELYLSGVEYSFDPLSVDIVPSGVAQIQCTPVMSTPGVAASSPKMIHEGVLPLKYECLLREFAHLLAKGRKKSFAGESLSGFNHPRSVLTSCDFRDADLRGSDLSCSWAPNSQWQDAKLTQASLQQVNLAGADLSRAQAEGVNLGDANLTGSIWKNTSLVSASLVGAECKSVDFSGVDLRKADLRGVLMRHCDLRGAKLRGARIDGLVLRHCKLEGVDWGDIQLGAADLRGSTGVAA